MPSRIEISHKTIVFTIVILLALWFVYQILDILFLLFISFVLMTAIRPLVNGLTNLKIPRVIAIVAIYAFFFAVISVSFASTIPTIVGQFTKLLQELPIFIERLLPYWAFDIRSFTQQISPFGQSVVKVTVSIFSNIFSLLTVLGFTFYLLLERKQGEAFLIQTLGEDFGRRILSTVEEIEVRLSAWVQGELILMLFIGILDYIGLSTLRVDYAIPLAILSGLLEIVPLIGPIASAVPAVLVAWGTSPLLALTVIALYVIVQQVENNIVVPLVMRKSVGLSPLITILALMIGHRFAGVLGAILAVPFVLVFQVIVGTILRDPSKQKSPRP